MNYKKLNEDLITMVEKTIDPDFRKMLKDTGDYQREILRKRAQYRQDQADYYNQRADEKPNDVWYRNNAKDYKNDADSLTKAANAKNMNADRIYREVARYIDVQNAQMVKIPTEGLTSKDLRKQLKALNKPGVFVIPWDISKQWHDTTSTSRYDFKNMNLFFFETKEGKIDIWAPYSTGDQDSPMISNDKVQPMMKDLNDGSIAERTPFIYVFFGEKTLDVRQAKNRRAPAYWDMDPNKRVKIDPQDVKPAMNPLEDKWRGGRYDKSGYWVDFKSIQRRLEKFKQQKGSYDKDVTEVIDKFSRAIAKYKELVANHDFLQNGTGTIQMQQLHDIIKKNASNFRYLMQAVEDKDGPSIAGYLRSCKSAVEKLDV